MSEFKVGDRVAVYGHGVKALATMEYGNYHRGSRGAVTQIVADDEINVALDSGSELEFHPKQCRKLVRKERRRVFITEFSLTQIFAAGARGSFDAAVSSVAMVSDDVEFVEVRRGKK